MDWKQRKPKLDELARRAGERGDELGPVVSDAVETISEQLDHFQNMLTHLSERLDALASQTATLEARVHEDVE